MAVLSREERIKLLEKSTYGVRGKRVNNKKKVTNRVSGGSIEKGVAVTAASYRLALNKQLNSLKNPHLQEVNRLSGNPELLAKDKEHYEQCKFFSDILTDYAKDYPLWFAIPNGGFRKKGERWRLQAEGQKAGIADTMLAKPVNGYNGLVIEFKKKVADYKSDNDAMRGVKDHQVSTLRMFATQGYAVAVAYGADEAMAIYKAYTGGVFSAVSVFYPLLNLAPLKQGEKVKLLHGEYVA